MTDLSGKIKTPAPFAESVLRGLAATPKRLEPKYFYDEVGSRLFDRICELDAYYVTRAEMAILRAVGPEVAKVVGPHAVIFEPGAGSTVKIRLLLDALDRPAALIPADISAAHLHAACAELAADYPELDLRPLAIDFTRDFALPGDVSRRGDMLVFFPGSTIGNFEPGAARDFLARLRRATGAKWLLIGADLKKDERTLVRAYDDEEGVTAAFNLNILTRINRELDGSFDLGGFRHEARWNAAQGRIEMHLVSRRAQDVGVLDETFRFAEGETIHTENSYKYAVPEFQALAESAGWTPHRHWTGEHNLFAVYLMRANDE
jgi:dimethylhistidine N-methyltransferase